jgi:hypothetical protein
LEDAHVKHTLALLSLLILAAASALPGQSPSTPPQPKPAVKLTPAQVAQRQAAAKKAKRAEVHLKPLSSIAFGGGTSTLGINMQASTNLNRYLNLRGTGNFFNYTANNISTNGFNIDAKLNMAAAGASLDFYPFPNHGFRLSPGALFYNQNRVSANGSVTSGTSITLNDQTYYSATANAVTGATPISVIGNLGLHTNKQALTATTGWGNVIPRKGGHWSFPVELGAAFIGSPSIGVNLTGWACTDQAQTNCANLASANNAIATQVQTNLTAQTAKWKSDLDPLKYYPIFSFGLSYNFRVR